MKNHEQVYQEIGKRLRYLIEKGNVPIDLFSRATGISEERLNNIIDAKGEEVTFTELAIISKSTLISIDYLVGDRDFPFTFEPTEENFQKLHDELVKIRDKRKIDGNIES